MTIVSTGSLSLKDLNDAKQLSMFIGASQSKQVMFDGVSTYSPNYANTNQILTPQLRIAGGGSDISSSASATRWYVQAGGTGSPTLVSTDANYTLSTGSQPITLTIKTNVLSTQTTMNYICEMDYVDPDTGFLVTSKADIQIVKVVNGISSVIAVMSNENVTLPASNTGVVSSYTGSNTSIQVYEGSTALTYDGVGTTNGKFNVTTAVSNITAGSSSGSGTTSYNMGVASAMNNAQDSATITFTVSGKTNTGASFSFTKVQNFSKAKIGTDSILQYLSMPNTFGKKADGTYVQSSVTINAWQVVGNGSATAYNGYLMIQTSVKGDFTDTVTAVANTTQFSSGAYTWSVTAGIKAFRVTLYTASGGVGQVDQETCYIIQDGTNSVYLNTWTPNGNAIRNSNGSVTLQADIYDGVSIQTASAYKWYVQDGTATTASGGDTDGGNGWRLIQSIANPSTNVTLATVTQSSTLAVGTYYVKYTFYGLTGETIGNATQGSQAITAGQALRVTVPSFPTGVVGANVYVGTVSGDANLKYQGNITTSAGNIVISTPIQTTTPTIPTVSTAVSTNSQLTVLPFGINGMATFKCIATYNTVKYGNVTTVQDLSDPVEIVLSGVDTFKNGIGTTQIKAICYQAGIEIDQTGTLFTYTWSLYDTNNALITTTYSTMSGKTVTIDGRDFVGRANLVCQVSK